MKNYAGVTDADDAIAAELIEAGIVVHRMPELFRTHHPEMRTIIMGELHGWTFKRQWYYWAAEGPGIEINAAERLHSTHGKVVRVDGHCGCPSPREWFKGLACGSYHVDTQDGLNALAQTINSLVAKSFAVGKDGPR
jgi:hypothetical protein